MNRDATTDSIEAAKTSTSRALPEPGEILAGKYRIEAVVGRGGMSVVYRAGHLQLGQLVALKVLSAAALHMPEYVARLHGEACAVSKIKSEHVVRVHDIGELAGSGTPYLVMEYLAGADLAAFLARSGPLSAELAIECIMQSCEALAEAHALGIIHRDLKPANLFLTESVDGRPCIKLLDFGISRMMHRERDAPLTDPGIVLGTPSCMAPEQMEAGDSVDARSDIWALGAILYELLVGRPPYAGESLPQIFMKIMRSRVPRPSAERSDVPPGLDLVIARCLAIEAWRRHASVADLAWALSAVGEPHARDSAERIRRVLDRRSSEGSRDGFAFVASPRHGSTARGSLGQRLLATSADGLVLGAAVGVGLLLARPMQSPAPAEPRVVTDPVADDAALSIAPARRPPVPDQERIEKPDTGTDAGTLAVVPAPR